MHHRGDEGHSARGGADTVTSDLVLEIASESALDQPLLELLSLRPFCEVTIVHQALYIAQLVSQLKAAAFEQFTHSKSRIPPLSAIASPLQVNITVIGCGAVGSRIVEAFRLSGRFHPTSISVVTRQPELLGHFSTAGIRCYREIESPIADSDCVVIAVQPGQFPALAKELKGCLRDSCVVLSVCCGIHADKVCSELRHPQCLSTIVDVQGIAHCYTRLTKRDSDLESNAVNDTSKRVPMQKEIQRVMNSKTFPNPSNEFIDRLLFVLVVSTVSRGVRVAEAIPLIWACVLPSYEARLPTSVPATDHSTRGIAFACGLQSLSAALSVPIEVAVDEIRRAFFRYVGIHV